MHKKLFLFIFSTLILNTVIFSQDTKKKLELNVYLGFGTKLNFDKYQIDEKLATHDLRIDPYFLTINYGTELSHGKFSAQLGGGWSSNSFSKNNKGSNWNGMTWDFDFRYKIFDGFQLGATLVNETSKLTLYSNSNSVIDITESFNSSAVQFGNSFWFVGPMISLSFADLRMTVGYLFNVGSGDWEPFYNDLPSNRISERGVNQMYAKLEFPLF